MAFSIAAIDPCGLSVITVAVVSYTAPAAIPAGIAASP